MTYDLRLDCRGFPLETRGDIRGRTRRYIDQTATVSTRSDLGKRARRRLRRSTPRAINRVQQAADLMGSRTGHLIVTFDSPIRLRLALHEADELDGDYVIALRSSRIHNTSGAIPHSVFRPRPFLFREISV